MAKFEIGSRIKNVFRRDVQPAPQRRDQTLAHPYSTLGVSQARSMGAPPMVYKHPLHHQDDLITEFLGGKPKGPQGYVRDDSSSAGRTERDAAPSCSTDDEPATRVKSIFLYGFLFPPIWLVGIFILCTQLRPTPEWEAGKTPEECSRLLLEARKAEVKWARRCLWALSALLVIAGLIVMVVLLVERN